MDPVQLLLLLKWRARQNAHLPVRSVDATSQTGVHLSTASRVNKALLRVEAKSGEKAMSQFQLRGNIEGDAHAVRKTWVSNKNEAEYGEELKAARQRCKHTNPAAWVLHLRIAGMKERGGRIIIKKLPNKLVMPGGRPPVESYKELQQTEFLNQVAPKSCLFADGAQSWKKYISGAKAKHKLSYRFVTHNRLQFTKKVRKAQKSTSSVAGT